MAIKLPDPGNGIPEQKTGNDEWTNMKIVRDNFADTNNAASRLVGTATGNVMQVGAFGVGSPPLAGSWSDFSKLTTANGGIETYGLSNGTDVLNLPPRFVRQRTAHLGFGHTAYPAGLVAQDGNLAFYFQSGGVESGLTAKAFHTVWHTSNTTVDSNKNIKTSSPVVRVFNDHLDKIHEANDLPIKYTRNGVGDYTIEGTTGLRENDWQIVIPKDDHDNQLIAFTLEDDNGTIHLKTYKRVFSMETFTFGPDLSAPLDIPESRWVDLHFNDLPQAQTDEPAI